MTLAWTGTITIASTNGTGWSCALEWVPSLGVELSLNVDAFGLVMVGLIAGIGALVYAYSYFYFRSDANLGGFIAALTVFAGSMHSIVVSQGLLTLIAFVEMTSISSHLLIGQDD